LGVGAVCEACRRLLDAEASRPSTWFFQFYKISLDTPADSEMLSAPVVLVHISRTAAFSTYGQRWVFGARPNTFRRS